MVWLPSVPDVQLFTDPPAAEENRQQAIAFIDSVISSTKPALLPDGSCLSEVPRAQTDPEVTDHEQDLRQLIAMCQRPHGLLSCLQQQQQQQDLTVTVRNLVMSRASTMKPGNSRCSNLQQSAEEQEETQQSTTAAQLYPNLEEVPCFVTRQGECSATNTHFNC